jgi:hypothetical protein
MATQIVQNSKLWVGGYDLTGRMNALAINNAADMLEETTLGDDTHIFTGGLKTVTMAHEGYFSGGDGDVDDVLFDEFTATNLPVSVAPTGGADGELAYSMQSLLAEYSPGAAVGEMFAFSVGIECRGDGLVRSTVMHNATRDASGNGTARQLGAVADGQSVFAALHVVEASGTLDVIVQSDADSDMLSTIDQLTFDQVTDVGSQWQSKAGAITDDWWRVNYTIGGGSPSFKFIVTIGIK